MIFFNAKQVAILKGLKSERVSVNFMAKNTNYKKVGNEILNKYDLKDNCLIFDNNPEYNGVVKIIMLLAPVFAN